MGLDMKREARVLHEKCENAMSIHKEHSTDYEPKFPPVYQITARVAGPNKVETLGPFKSPRVALDVLVYYSRHGRAVTWEVSVMEGKP